MKKHTAKLKMFPLKGDALTDALRRSIEVCGDSPEKTHFSRYDFMEGLQILKRAAMHLSMQQGEQVEAAKNLLLIVQVSVLHEAARGVVGIRLVSKAELQNAILPAVAL